MKEKLMNGLMGFAMFLQNQRHFRAIKNAFSALLPIIIVGSFCTLFSNVVCNTNPGYFSLANVPGMSWLGNLGPLFTSANYGTMNFIAIGLVILLSMELGGELPGPRQGAAHRGGGLLHLPVLHQHPGDSGGRVHLSAGQRPVQPVYQRPRVVL